MITKKVEMRSASKSSFSRLISYLTDTQSKLNRVGDISITNCVSEQLKWATLEIEHTQKINTRAVSDRTYHLLISFPEHENIDKETLKAIEKELCESLGFGQHQRISVVHHDTDNLHVHVAINKVHPHKFTLHEPYRDYYIRNNVCSLLEDKFNLHKDNHITKNTQGKSAANDMEKIAGMESLMTYISELNLSAKSWDELHSILSENGLEVKLRGNGLIFQDKLLGITVKGSSVGYSKSKLEKELGQYTPNKNNKDSKENFKNYNKKPLKSKIDTTQLFLKYQQNKEEQKKQKNELYKKAIINRNLLIENAKNKAKLKRNLLKLTKNNPFKKILYKSIYSTLQNDIKQAQNLCAKEILAAKKMKSLSWLEWLQNESQNGNKEALSILRNRSKKLNNNEIDSFYSDGKERKEIISGLKIDHVTKKGNTVYSIASTVIKDSGFNIKVSKSSTKNGLEAAILMAKYKYGTNLNITGSEEFKKNVIDIVVEKNIEITFSDPNLEKYKNILLGDKYERERSERERRYRNGFEEITRERSTTDRRTTDRRTTDRRTTGKNTRSTRTANTLSRITNIRRITGKSFAIRSNNMRIMPECDMASLERRSKVLLSGNESNNMENQRTRNINIVRRNISSTRLFGRIVTGDHLEALDKYVNERNSKREKGIDIKKHIRYNEFDFNSQSFDVRYNGMRYLNNKALALFEIDNNILVVPIIDKKTETQLRKCRISDLITISKTGITINKTGFKIESKGR